MVGKESRASRRTYRLSLIILLSILVLLFASTAQPAMGMISSVMASDRTIVLSQAGHVHIVINDSNIKSLNIAVLDQANMDLMLNHSGYSNISELSRSNVSSVDLEADLPAGTYHMVVGASLKDLSDANVDDFSNDLNNSVTITYSSQTLPWGYVTIFVAVSAIFIVYVLSKKQV